MNSFERMNQEAEDTSKIEKEALDPQRIKEAISEVEKARKRGELVLEPGVEFDQAWKVEYENKKLLGLLAGKPLTDLGAGNYGYTVIELGHKARAPRITAVDLVGKWYQLGNDPERREMGVYSGVDMENVKLIQTDMLEHISELPDGYGNFMINGIDANILDKDRYINYLLAHLKRCVPDGGVVLGAGTHFLPQLEKFNFKNVSEEIFDREKAYSELGCNVFKKIKK